MSKIAANLVPTSSSAVEGITDPDTFANLLKAAGDPLRLQILRVLNNNAFGALELSEIFDMRQNAMSHHLKLLSRASLVVSRREGTHIFYRRNPQQIQYRSFYDELFSIVNDLELPVDIQRKLDAIQNVRAAASKAFFRQNADKFREQQDLIASFPQYGEAVLNTLDNYVLRGRNVLEVGPGQGDLLQGLCARFQQVYALDNAEEMLNQAKATARQQALGKVEFILGDTASPKLDQLGFDVITVNMVLHHTPAPATIISDLAQRLTKNGLLLITELCEHDQDWARDACGDLWLGFDPKDLSTWAKQSGLQEVGSEILALKNGFSIQIRQFSRSYIPLDGNATGATTQ